MLYGERDVIIAVLPVYFACILLVNVCLHISAIADSQTKNRIREACSLRESERFNVNVLISYSLIHCLLCCVGMLELIYNR